jgi:hypothetical protein
MHFHHFALGQIVRLMAREGDAPDKMAKYKVTTLLPSESSSAIASNMKNFFFSRLAWERDLIGVIRPGWRIERP